jgi:hypothetical protein
MQSPGRLAPETMTEVALGRFVPAEKLTFPSFYS